MLTSQITGWIADDEDTADQSIQLQIVELRNTKRSISLQFKDEQQVPSLKIRIGTCNPNPKENLIDDLKRARDFLQYNDIPAKYESHRTFRRSEQRTVQSHYIDLPKKERVTTQRLPPKPPLREVTNRMTSDHATTQFKFPKFIIQQKHNKSTKTELSSRRETRSILTILSNHNLPTVKSNTPKQDTTELFIKEGFDCMHEIRKRKKQISELEKKLKLKLK